MGKVWDFLNGKKTIAAAVLGAVATTLEQAGQQEAATYFGIAAQVLTAVGVAHKAVKASAE